VGIHLLDFAPPFQESLDVSLELGPHPGPTGDGVRILAVAPPAAGLLQIAFVEFTHGLLSINENRTVKLVW
jgi:hypothetical protein